MKINLYKFSFLIATMLLISICSFAQKVFSVEYASQADVKVFVVDYASQADLLVHKKEYASQVSGNQGDWFFCEICFSG